MAYNAETKASYGVCLVQKVEYIQHPLAALDQLDPSGVLQQHYLFFPSALAFTNSQSLSRKFQEVEERLIKIQSGMKCDDWQTVKHGPQNGVEPDLVELPRRLTSILHGYASDSVVADVLGRIIHFLHEQLRVQKQNPQQYDTMVVDSLLDILAEAEKMQQDMKGRVSYARDVIQSLSQMVYAYRAQRDNELNVRLAKLSHKSNQLNLKLSKIAAHESHMNTIIAKSAVEYSLDMQVISIVTLLFLPGTFMATLFSASFWNFQPGHEGPVASKWGWLYFALTITLTATVFSAWKAYSRWKRTKQLQFKSSIDISALDAIEELTEEDLE
ncbi:hypothetical protein BCR34DRAFT_354248 [Clohesyomyces aquaticus]|uniref:Cora-like Mg2+ transporter protein-domain-containing protein n=1 Tax=Clohesyomyces aquaticus TaxID=1231657 RepID=A0A1Y1ZJ93_9PLEO|nr:hypothetical protein BCR34DRAFT_354248 [Clohesyomyces aquaticus]